MVSFLLTAKYYSIVWIDHLLFIHSSADTHLACSQFLVVMNNAAMNMPEYVLCERMFHFSWVST